MQQEQKFNKVPANPQLNKPTPDKTGDWISVIVVMIMLCAIVTNSSKTNKGANTDTTATKQTETADTVIKQTIEQSAADTTFLFLKRIYEKQN